jgi:hypothetical protein
MRRLMAALTWAIFSVGCSSDAPAPNGGAAAVGEAGAPAGGAPLGGAAAGGLLPVAQAQGPLPKGVLRLQRTSIMDPSGFEKPMVAATAFAPVGWRTQGGYVWGSGGPCATGDVLVNWSAIGPDGISAVAFVSKPRWEIIQSFLDFDRGPPGPCETAKWTTAQQFLEALARQAAPQARILDYRTRPDLIQEQEALIKLIPPLQSELMQVQMRVDAGQILFGHSVDGREVREMIVARVLFTETRLADLMNPGRIAMTTLQASPSSMIYARAPAGELNLDLPTVISKSVRPMPDWSNRVFKHNMEQQERNFRATMERSKADAAQRQQMFDAHQRKMADMQASQAQRDRMYDQQGVISDRQQREFVETVRGVETYHEPIEGGVVQLDNTYDHAWRVRDGTYLLTNDPNFRPGLIGLEGQQLNKVQ